MGDTFVASHLNKDRRSCDFTLGDPGFLPPFLVNVPCLPSIGTQQESGPNGQRSRFGSLENRRGSARREIYTPTKQLMPAAKLCLLENTAPLHGTRLMASYIYRVLSSVTSQ